MITKPEIPAPRLTCIYKHRLFGGGSQFSINTVPLWVHPAPGFPKLHISIFRKTQDWNTPDVSSLMATANHYLRQV